MDLGTLGWNEPEKEVLDELTRWASFGADRAALDLMYSTQHTPSQVTEASVRAGLRLLLANGLIQPIIPEQEVMIVLDPPT